MSDCVTHHDLFRIGCGVLETSDRTLLRCGGHPFNSGAKSGFRKNIKNSDFGRRGVQLFGFPSPRPLDALGPSKDAVLDTWEGEAKTRRGEQLNDSS